MFTIDTVTLTSVSITTAVVNTEMSSFYSGGHRGVLFLWWTSKSSVFKVVNTAVSKSHGCEHDGVQVSRRWTQGRPTSHGGVYHGVQVSRWWNRGRPTLRRWTRRRPSLKVVNTTASKVSRRWTQMCPTSHEGEHGGVQVLQWWYWRHYLFFHCTNHATLVCSQHVPMCPDAAPTQHWPAIRPQQRNTSLFSDRTDATPVLKPYRCDTSLSSDRTNATPVCPQTVPMRHRSVLRPYPCDTSLFRDGTNTHKRGACIPSDIHSWYLTYKAAHLNIKGMPWWQTDLITLFTELSSLYIAHDLILRYKRK